MYKTPLEHIREKTAAVIPSMRWDGKEDFAVWQDRARVKLTELVGLPFKKCEDKFKIEYREDRGTFTETRFCFQSEEGFFVPCHLWVPKAASGPLPLVVCLQGHSKGAHISLGRPKYPGDAETISGGDRDFAVRIIKEGYCALVMEQRCFGELGGTEKGPDCTVSSMAALLIGRTTTGERVWDLQRALDTVERQFSEIDKDKIICMGNSGGGTTTFFASCLEGRIRYAMPSSYFCSFDDCIGAMHHCACNFIPNIRLFFDMGDLAGLIAPRPLVIVSGREDPIFPQHGVQKAFKEAKRMYEGAGASDKLKLVIGEGGHRFYADLGWGAMNPYIRQG
jgi:dienelactone hydrolase